MIRKSFLNYFTTENIDVTERVFPQKQRSEDTLQTQELSTLYY